MNHWRAKYAGVRTLIVGGAGFIGRAVARALSMSQADVLVTARDAKRAMQLFAEADVPASVIQAELRTRDDVGALIDAVQPAMVFNLAGYGVDRSEVDEHEMWLVNRNLPFWLAEELAITPFDTQNVGRARLVHAGSALEYGMIGGNLDEAMPGQPTVLYGHTKLAGTYAVASVATRTGLPSLTARLFTVYGPGEHAGRLLPTLLHAANTGEAVALSAGTQRRDFTFVDDVAEGMMRLGVADLAPGSIINIATGVQTSVRQFIEIAADVLALRPDQTRFGEVATRAEEMQHDDVAIHRLGRATGWAPATSIADGVLRTWQALRPNPS